MPRLRILRASGNRLRALQVHWFAGLRTLYADTNALEGEALLAVAPASTAKTVGRAAGKAASSSSALGKLENLSLRNQACGRAQGLRLDFEDVRDAKRLYLSGASIYEHGRMWLMRRGQETRSRLTFCRRRVIIWCTWSWRTVGWRRCRQTLLRSRRICGR